MSNKLSREINKLRKGLAKHVGERICPSFWLCKSRKCGHKKPHMETDWTCSTPGDFCMTRRCGTILKDGNIR